MDVAPALKRKGAEAGAPEPWLLHGIPVPATKIRRLDAEVPPVVPPGVGVPTPRPQQPFGVEEAAAVGVALVLKRKGAEAGAPEPWLLDGVSVPATKIRRLDADVPPVVQPGAGVPPPQPLGVEEALVCNDELARAAAGGVAMAPAANDERAIVVYQPAEAERNLLLGPLRPGGLLRVHPDWIHGLKSTVLQEASNHRFEQLAARDQNPNLAMVLWAPTQAHGQATTTTAPGAEMMDADQDGNDGASMEVEQDAAPASVPMQGEAFHQQQQWPPQHCMAPQQLPAASYQPSPVTWSG